MDIEALMLPILIFLSAFWFVLLLINEKLGDIRDCLRDICEKLRGDDNCHHCGEKMEEGAD